MAELTQAKDDAVEAFRFRVSDVVAVPLRGVMLRLRVVDGTPSMRDLGVGATLRLRARDGSERDVRIIGHTTTGGIPTQTRLERARELDVLIDSSAVQDGIEIGWMASGPVS